MAGSRLALLSGVGHEVTRHWEQSPAAACARRERPSWWRLCGKFVGGRINFLLVRPLIRREIFLRLFFSYNQSTLRVRLWFFLYFSQQWNYFWGRLSGTTHQAGWAAQPQRPEHCWQAGLLSKALYGAAHLPTIPVLQDSKWRRVAEKHLKVNCFLILTEDVLIDLRGKRKVDVREREREGTCPDQELKQKPRHVPLLEIKTATFQSTR